jgi:hypothetical protein
MEIILKDINFESVALKKLGSGYKADTFGYADTEGNLQSSTTNTRTVVIPITESMRSDGFVVANSRHFTNNPAIVFYNSVEASSSTFVGVYTDGFHEEHTIYVSPEDIPSEATHLIANGYKDNELTVWGNYLDDVVSDYAFTNGYLVQTGQYVEDPTYLSSKIIPVDNTITYYTKYKRCATYDTNLNFIKLLEPRYIINTTVFDSNVKFIRICGLVSDGNPYVKY